MTTDRKPRDTTSPRSLGAVSDTVRALILSKPDEAEIERVVRARVETEMTERVAAIQEKITKAEARIAPADRERWPRFMLSRMDPEGLCGFSLLAGNDVTPAAFGPTASFQEPRVSADGGPFVPVSDVAEVPEPRGVTPYEPGLVAKSAMGRRP